MLECFFKLFILFNRICNNCEESISNTQFVLKMTLTPMIVFFFKFNVIVKIYLDVNLDAAFMCFLGYAFNYVFNNLSSALPVKPKYIFVLLHTLTQYYHIKNAFQNLQC